MKMVAELGFEPRQTVSETVVLPLHHSASSRGEYILKMGPMSQGSNR